MLVSTQMEPGEMILFALGQTTDIPEGFGIEVNQFGYPDIQAGTHRTAQQDVFAAGDVVTGTKSVVQAIEGGRAAASECDRYLGGDGIIDEVLYDRPPHNPKIGPKDGFGRLSREMPRVVPLEKRKQSFSQTEDSFTMQQAGCEAERCLQCDLRCDLHKVQMWTEY